MGQGIKSFLTIVEVKRKLYEVSKMINNFETNLRDKHTHVRWIYIEPDMQEWK